MMRGRERMAVAVRRPDGIIEVKDEPVSGFYRSRWVRFPLFRGLVILWDSLGTGLRALTYSADVAAGEEAKLSGPAMWGTVAFSFIVGLGLFFALPMLVASTLDHVIVSDWLSNTVEGLVRLAIFLAYLVGIGRVPDVRRVFAYHGAEHKVINAHEAGEPLTVERARPYGTSHARCGTGFLLIVVVVSVLVFGFLGRPSLPLRLASRLVLVPVIAAISYEIVRLSARHRQSILARIVMAPSLLLQSLTTREPSEDMVEVALVALERILPAAVAQEPSEPGLAAVDTSLSSSAASATALP